MSTHTIHDDIHDAGLADECPRCLEHAQHPLHSLDETSLRDLVGRTISDVKARSMAEATAMGIIRTKLAEACELVEIDPMGFVQYVEKRKGARLVAVLQRASQR